MPKILGREPALIITLIGSLLVLAAAFNIHGATMGVAAAVVAFLTAALVAVTTRPVAPALYKSAITAGVALVTEFGLHLSAAQVGAFTALAMTILALLVRAQVTPADDPATGVAGEMVGA
jgi:membrane-bound ClpP family serine protease